jgi:hypothetical protein
VTNPDDRPAPPAAGSQTTAPDDRTMGIPPRSVNMWPATTPGQRPPRADTLAEIRRLHPPPLTVPDAPVALLVDALRDAGTATHHRPADQQHAALAAVAERYGLPAGPFAVFAHDVGTTLTRTDPQPAAAGGGHTALNALHGAPLAVAAETSLARTRLRWAASVSDPDLPRLMIALNGARNQVPAGMLLTVPAATHGPAATVTPTRSDLIGWYGIRRGIGHLDAIVRAAAAGRTWAANTHGTRSPVDTIMLTLGVLELTHPASAAELARAGPATLRLADLRALLRKLPTPASPVDLSDAALRAACRRAGWLTGTSAETPHRAAAERRLPSDVAGRLRAHLAAGNTTALADGLRAVAPTDADLDPSTWRHVPRPGGTGHLLGEASREALRRFAGATIAPHATPAAAILARYPEQILRRALAVTLDATGPAPPDPTDPGLPDPPAPTADLAGL